MKYLLSSLVVCVALCGCRAPIEQREADWQQYVTNRVVEALPKGYSNLEYLGNNWFTFDFRGHKFMFRFNQNNHGWISDTIKLD